jgi:hypothetical protein
MAESKDKECFFPKIFTTHPKNGKRRKNKKTIYEDSIAKSLLPSIEKTLGLTDLFGGKIVHVSFDCPNNLRIAFNEACKFENRSSCKIQQEIMASHVIAVQTKKHALGNTMSRLVDANFTIENLNFGQYVQSRPRRLIRNVEPETLTSSGLLTCQIGNGTCLNQAIGKGVYLKTGKEYRLCKVHLESFVGNPRDWKVS